MHEYGIVSALLEQVEAEARSHGSTRVDRLHVRIGELCGVDPELLSTAYETFRERSICATAELCVENVPARWECPSCGRLIARGTMLRCEQCQKPAILSAGDEIILDRIEMEVPHV